MATETAEAQRLLQAARDHKRAARRHRDKAQQLMRELDQLVAAAAARGIHIEINTAQPRRHSGQQEGHPSRG